VAVELLELSTREDRGWTVVTARGQLDVATAPRLRQAMVEAQYGGAIRVVLDLDGIEFLDSMGLGVIVGALKRSRTHDDSEFVIACSRDRLLHLFEVTRLMEILRIVASVDEVLQPAGA
jgi:anti-sigma B factor antagonist